MTKFLVRHGGIMRLTTAFTGVIVANIMMTFLSVTATRNGRRTSNGVSNRDLATLLHGNGTVDPAILRNFTPTTPVPEDVECHVQVRRLDLAMDPTFWNMTPSPPSAEDVECYVEVRRIERVGGRCISLGARGIPACQAGPNLEPFNDECQGRNGGGRGRGRGRGARRNFRRQRNGRSAFNRRNQSTL